MQTIPIILITGFLGSGKTSFVNWVLKKAPDKHISIILNEFGDVKLEPEFVKQHPEGIVELANGCMCCAAKKDVPRVINFILEKAPRTELILIEASGLSDPDPIKETIENMSDVVFLLKTVGIIDCVNFLETYKEFNLVMSQAAEADILLLSKVIKAQKKDINAIQEMLKVNMPDSRIYNWTDDLDINTLLKGYDDKGKPITSSMRSHAHEPYAEFWFHSDDPVDPVKLGEALKKLKDSVYRAKGYCIDKDDNVYSFQSVAGDYSYKSTKKKKKNSAILMLGRKLDPEMFRIKLKKLLNTES